MNRPIRYLFFVLKGIAYPACLFSAGMIARSISGSHLSTGALILGLVGIVVLAIFGYIFFISFSYDLKAVLAKRPMPTFAARFTDHGPTLYSVIQAIRNEEVEVLAIFSETGTKLAEVSNFHESMVRIGQTISPSTLSHETTLVHNHPNSNSTFSPNDIAAFMYYRCNRAIVVTEDETYEAVFSREYSIKDAKRAKKRLKRLIRQTKNDKNHVLANKILAREFGYQFYQHDTANTHAQI